MEEFLEPSSKLSCASTSTRNFSALSNSISGTVNFRIPLTQQCDQSYTAKYHIRICVNAVFPSAPIVCAPSGTIWANLSVIHTSSSYTNSFMECLEDRDVRYFVAEPMFWARPYHSPGKIRGLTRHINTEPIELYTNLERLTLRGLVTWGELPASLRSLSIFGSGAFLEWPATMPVLMKLHLGDEFDSYIPHLPSSLKTIHFGDSFNQPINGFPPKLVNLTLGKKFSTPQKFNVDRLFSAPNSATAFVLVDDDYRVKFTLPPLSSSLRRLQIYERALSGHSLPASLTSLDLTNDGCVARLPRSLPEEYLYTLTLVGYIILPETLPRSLRALDLQNCILGFTETLQLPPLERLYMRHPNTGKQNKTLQQQQINLYFTGLCTLATPEKLLVLKVGEVMALKLNIDCCTSLKTLCVHNSKLIKSYVGNWPSSLHKFTSLGRLPCNLPTCVSELALLGNFNSDELFPETVTRLVLGNAYNCKIKKLPPCLTHLYFGLEFDQPLPDLPNSLVLLSFGYSFNQYLYGLPSSLCKLLLGERYSKFLYNLPSQLEKLQIITLFDK